MKPQRAPKGETSLDTHCRPSHKTSSRDPSLRPYFRYQSARAALPFRVDQLLKRKAD